MGEHCRDKCHTDPAMGFAPVCAGEAGQRAAYLKRLQKQQRHRDDTGKACRDVNWIAPGQQRAGQRQGDGNDKGRAEGGPDQERFGLGRHNVRPVLERNVLPGFCLWNCS